MGGLAFVPIGCAVALLAAGPSAELLALCGATLGCHRQSTASSVMHAPATVGKLQLPRLDEPACGRALGVVLFAPPPLEERLLHEREAAAGLLGER